MPIFYIDTNTFSTATAAWTNNTLTTKASDGYYSNGEGYRRQVSGLFQAQVSCTLPTITFTPSTTTCSFNTAGGGGSSCTGGGTVTIAYGNYNLWVYVSMYTGPTPLTINEIDATIGTVDLSASTTSQFVTGYSAKVLFGPGTYSFNYLVIGSGGSNTGGAGGILYEFVS
jgi:hypothetical protein